jgi:hypothetical protein
MFNFLNSIKSYVLRLSGRELVYEPFPVTYEQYKNSEYMRALGRKYPLGRPVWRKKKLTHQS